MPKYKCATQCKNIITKAIGRHDTFWFYVVGVQVVLTCEPKKSWVLVSGNVQFIISLMKPKNSQLNTLDPSSISTISMA